MDFLENWNRALQNTEIIRSRVRSLMTFADTMVPYIILSESSINEGDTVVRTGKVTVEKPALILPPNIPQFQGFEFEENEVDHSGSFMHFLLVRGINIPSLKYNNETYRLDVHEEKLSQAIKHFNENLQRKENVTTGLITGPEDCWQFSLLLYICTQVARNAQTDIQQLLKQLRNKK